MRLLALIAVVGVSALFLGAGVSHASGEFTVTVTGSPVAGAGPAPIEVSVTNNTGSTLNPTVTINLPASNVSYGNDASGGTCDATNFPTITCTLSAPLDSTNSASIDFTVTPDPSASGNITASAADSTNTGSSDPLPIAQQADLGVALTGVPAHAIAGGSDFTATATVTNNGPSDSGSDWSATVTLPSSNLVFGSTDCNVVNLIATCSGSNLGPNGTAAFQLHISAPHDAAAGGQQIDAAVAPGSASEGANTVSDSDQATVTVDQQADLTVSVQNTVASPPVIAGGATPGAGSFSTQATVTNNGGPSDSHGYRVTYALSTTSAGQSLGDVKLSALPGSCAYTPVSSDDTVVCTSSTSLTPSGPGSSEAAPALEVDAASSALGSYTVTATVAPIAPVTDPGASNNTDSDSTSVVAHADLSITASGPATDQIAGKSAGFDYTVTVNNSGPSVDHGGYIAHLPLESGVTFSAAGSTAGCVAAGNGVDCKSTADFASGGNTIYTVHVTTDPGIVPDNLQVAGTDLTDTATVDFTSVVAGQSDANPTNNHSDATVHINAESDLSLSETIPGLAASYVAGDPTQGALTYRFTVTNGGESTHKGSFSVTDTLPTGFIFQATSTTGCSAVGQQVTCTDTAAILPNGTKVFNVDVKINSHVLDGAYQDGTSATVGGTVATGATATPDQTGTNNTGTPQSATVITIANLKVISESASVSTLPANDLAANSVTFSLVVKNDGPSDATGVNITSPLAGTSGKAAFLFAAGNPVTGELDAGASRTLTLSATANPLLGHAPPTTIVSGPFTITDSATVISNNPTTQTSDTLAPAMNVRINTVSAPVTDLRSLPSDVNDVLSWQAPAADSGGVPIDGAKPYQITVTRPSGTPAPASCTAVSATVCTIDVTTAQANLPCRGPDTVCYNVQPLVTGQSYTYDVRVRNAVGLSDPTTISDTTSGNSKSLLVAKNTSVTFGNCKVATPDQPVCVQYTVPSGGGGLAGITGNTFLPSGFCGSLGCTGGGVLDTVAPQGFTNPKNPIVETINWDASVSPNGKNSIVFWQSPGFTGQLPACAKNAVAFPNPCIRKLVVLQNNGNPNEVGDVHAEILFTSDQDALSGKH